METKVESPQVEGINWHHPYRPISAASEALPTRVKKFLCRKILLFISVSCRGSPFLLSNRRHTLSRPKLRVEIHEYDASCEWEWLGAKGVEIFTPIKVGNEPITFLI